MFESFELTWVDCCTRLKNKEEKNVVYLRFYFANKYTYVIYKIKQFIQKRSTHVN